MNNVYNITYFILILTLFSIKHIKRTQVNIQNEFFYPTYSMFEWAVPYM